MTAPQTEATQIPVCLWLLVRDRRSGKFHDRRSETLFIDARDMGSLVDHTHRELSEDEIGRIADAYHAWHEGRDKYEDIPGFCKSATLKQIRSHDYMLTPGRYMGAKPQEDDGEPFEEKMARLAAEWREQQAEAARLDAAIAENLAKLGYD